MFDILALGEALIDFSPADKGPMGNPSLEMNPGGAPINCLAANARLGGSSAFIGMVGNDFFGKFLEQSMNNIGIDTTGLVYTDSAYTTIDFVYNDSDGDRYFVFFRNPGADMLLEAKHLNDQVLKATKTFHFGGLSLTDEPARSATYAALDRAKELGIKISFDPNYRDTLWPNPEAAIVQMQKGAEYADIIKVGVEEMTMLTGFSETQIEEGAEKLFNMGIPLVFVTAGAKGAYYKTKDEQGFVSGFTVKTLDTTGCGDAFFGAILYTLYHKESWSLYEKVRFANATAALCATKRTGFPAMPDYKTVETFLSEQT